MRNVLILVLLFATLISFTSASSFYSVNGSEPSFLKGSGPQDERADEPLAAVVVAVAVVAVVLRGLHRHRSA